MEWLLVSWPTLILMGLGLRMSLRLTYGARGPEPGDPVYLFLNITGWVLVALGVAPAIIGGAATFVGTIIVLLAIATVIEAVIQRRMAQRRSMCRILALLVERGAKLESSVLLAGQALRGRVGHAATQLFDAVNRGMPLAAALVRYPGALPREAPAYLAAGHTTEVRLAALRELSRTDSSEVGPVWRNCVDRISYLTSVLLVMAAVLTFVMIKIVPQYQNIFYEFDLELPAMTQLSVWLSEFVVDYLAVPLLLIFMASSLVLIVVAICYLCDVPVLTSLSDRIFRGRRTADVLRIIALATDHEQPLDGVLHRVALAYPSPLIRRQLLPAAGAVEAGVDWRDALLRAHVVSKVEHSLLQTAERVGNLPWALRELANRRDKLAAYRLMAGLQVFYPIVILLLGAFVAFYAVSLFIPLVRLIQGLSS